MRRFGPFVAISLGLLVPGAVAEEVEDVMSLDLDADELVFREQSIYTADDAQDLRQDIDEDHGNGDGVVTFSEINKHNAENRLAFDEDKPDCFDEFRLARIDGSPPRRISYVSEFASSNAQGPVSSTAPIGVTNLIGFAFEARGDGPFDVEVDYGAMDTFGVSIGCYMGMDWGSWNWNYPTWTRPGCCASGLTFDADDQSTSTESGYDVLVQPRAGATIHFASIQPPDARKLWDGKGLRADTESEENYLFSHSIRFQLEGAGSGSSLGGTVRDVGAVVGLIALGGTFVFLGAGLATEYGRYHFLRWLLLIPGFTRLEKDEVLEHSKRDELYRFIKQNPGPSFSDLRRELDLSNGTLVHHLRILEAQEFLKSVRDGFRTRFYLRGPKVVVESYLTRTQQQLLDVIHSNPGLTQKELAQLVGVPRESVSYHTKQLASRGRLQIRQDGKWRRYWATATGPLNAAPKPSPGP